jgi:O-antigen/teichoic acid export membrane protein
MNVLMPLFAARGQDDDQERARHLVLKGSKWSVALATCAFVSSAILGEAFILNWIGPELEEAVIIWNVLMIAVLLSALKEGAACALVMQDHHRFAGTVSILGALLNVLLSILFVKLFGVVGIAVATVVSLLVLDLPCVLYKAICEFGFRPRVFYTEVLQPMLLPTAAQTLLLIALYPVIDQSSLLSVLWAMSSGAICFGGIFLLSSLSQSERELLGALALHAKAALGQILHVARRYFATRRSH